MRQIVRKCCGLSRLATICALVANLAPGARLGFLTGAQAHSAPADGASSRSRVVAVAVAAGLVLAFFFAAAFFWPSVFIVASVPCLVV